MTNIKIDNVIADLILIREKLHNGIYGERTTPVLTNAICLLRELEAIKAEERIQALKEDGKNGL